MYVLWASLVAQIIKNLPTMRETWVWSLGREDPLEKEMATHSSTLAWRIPWMEEPGGLQSMGTKRAGNDWVTSLLHFFYYMPRIQKWARRQSLLFHRRLDPLWEDRALKTPKGNFPHDPVAKTLHSQCKGPRFNPWSGNLILHTATKLQHSHINFKNK